MNRPTRYHWRLRVVRGRIVGVREPELEADGEPEADPAPEPAPARPEEPEAA